MKLSKYVVSSKYKSSQKSAAGRIRNNVAFAMREFTYLPKFMMIILEDDILEAIHQPYKHLKVIFDRIIKWLSNQIWRLVQSQNEMLPKKAQRNTEIIWLIPTVHRGYDNNEQCQLFSESLKNYIATMDYQRVIELKQLWDPDNQNFVVNKRVSAEGKNVFWRAFDRTIRFCDTVLNANKDKINERFCGKRRRAESSRRAPR